MTNEGNFATEQRAELAAAREDGRRWQESLGRVTAELIRLRDLNSKQYDELVARDKELARLRLGWDELCKMHEAAEAENARLREENMRLQGRLAATQDHHDAEHEKCARDALKETM